MEITMFVLESCTIKSKSEMWIFACFLQLEMKTSQRVCVCLVHISIERNSDISTVTKQLGRY